MPCTIPSHGVSKPLKEIALLSLEPQPLGCERAETENTGRMQVPCAYPGISLWVRVVRGRKSRHQRAIVP